LLRKKDVDMAANLIESMTTPWDPENYRDTYTERVEQIVEAKKNNEECHHPKPGGTDRQGRGPDGGSAGVTGQRQGCDR